MKYTYHVTAMHILVVLSIRVSEARDLRDLTDLPPRTGLLLSALCIEDGDVRPACLEDVSSLSIRQFLDKVIEGVRDNQRYGDILRDMAINKDDVIQNDNVIPEKRGRSRNGNVSGFYSNW
ncbi:uncharacterized protein LOC128221822 [Mya arenaria]|nr:uncharacterized protein LOC128221822 [Mya arenaria]XP_052786388.1 uncharacterized protein LOC128221822 [Mya arenaria]